jgi:hypothetical protein
MEYTIVGEFDSAKVVKEVNKLLGDGWELYGPFVIDVGSGDQCSVYFQPMIKRSLPPTGDRGGASEEEQRWRR